MPATSPQTVGTCQAEEAAEGLFKALTVISTKSTEAVKQSSGEASSLYFDFSYKPSLQLSFDMFPAGLAGWRHHLQLPTSWMVHPSSLDNACSYSKTDTKHVIAVCSMVS